MKKKVFLGFSMFSLLLVSCGGEESTEETTEENEVVEEVVEPITYTIDMENSVINWTAYQLADANVADHTGTVNVSAGDVTVDAETITSASMDIDMNSIISDGGEKLDGHLQNEDFFNVTEFLSTTFTFDRHEEGMIYGSISVIGMEMSVEAPAELITDDSGLTINISEFKINMSDLPFFIADIEMPVEEQHNPSVGFTATIKATK